MIISLLVIFINYNSLLFYSRISNTNISSRPRITEKKDNEIDSSYNFYLSIPKISLYVPLYDINSPKNNVNYNVEINEKSDMPNVMGGNFILESHSGLGYHSYFKDLYKLKKGDIVIVTYHEQLYTYKIEKYYDRWKTGQIRINRDYNKSTITLITCVGNKKQGIYIGYLEKKESLF